MTTFFAFCFFVAFCGFFVAIVRRKNMWQWAVAAVLLLSITELVKPDSDDTTPQPASTKQPATSVETAQPTPDRHTERQAAREYWDKYVINLVLSDAYRKEAAEAGSRGDAITMLMRVKKAEQFCEVAKHNATTGIPDGWNDVAKSAASSADDMSSAYAHMRDAIDSGKPSDAADAMDDSAESLQENVEAIHLARVHYVNMGGKWSDISDGLSESKSLGNLKSAIEAGK